MQNLTHQKKNKKNFVELLGSGKPLREFLFNDDLSEAILLLLRSSKKKFYISQKIIFQFLMLVQEKIFRLKILQG